MLKKLFKNRNKYRFQEPKNAACFVCDHIMNKKRPVLFVSHDKEDSSWQFLCGETDHNDDNIKIISLNEMTEIDDSVNDLYEMPIGFGAERSQIDEPWKPFKIKE